MFLLNLREGLLKYQKHYQSLLDEKARVLENVDKKFAIKHMEQEMSQEQIEKAKKEHIEEVEQKFSEVIDMLIQSYSENV